MLSAFLLTEIPAEEMDKLRNSAGLLMSAILIRRLSLYLPVLRLYTLFELSIRLRVCLLLFLLIFSTSSTNKTLRSPCLQNRDVNGCTRMYLLRKDLRDGRVCRTVEVITEIVSAANMRVPSETGNDLRILFRRRGLFRPNNPSD